ncbi:MAG: hypothetical protein K2X53_02255, partial [Alphaproteobacteria bacterium]|nr:hypothetical protein [Alphaproteobacteria bacterium]
MLIRSALYITTHITGTFRYFSWCAHPNIWYARIQKKIIDFGLREGNTINFSTKFYPNDFLNNPNKEYIQSLKQDAILSEPLVGILTKYDFDLIITEAAATTLLEILCTKSQV